MWEHTADHDNDYHYAHYFDDFNNVNEHDDNKHEHDDKHDDGNVGSTVEPACHFGSELHQLVVRDRLERCDRGDKLCVATELCDDRAYSLRPVQREFAWQRNFLVPCCCGGFVRETERVFVSCCRD